MAPNHISTLGSLHDYLLKNQRYSLGHFISAIYAFRPDIILTEVRPNAQGPIEGSIDGGIEQAVVYGIGEELSIPVIATDWFDDTFIEDIAKESALLSSGAKEELKPLWEKYGEDFSSLSLLDLHSKSIQSEIEKIYGLYKKYGLIASHKRNVRILENIKQALSKFSNKRVLIIFGLDHKFFIDNGLKALPGNQVVEVSTWAHSKDLKSSGFLSLETKQKILKHLNECRQTLNERLRSGFYKGELSQRLQKKLENFEAWEKFVSEM